MMANSVYVVKTIVQTPHTKKNTALQEEFNAKNETTASIGDTKNNIRFYSYARGGIVRK